MNQGLPFSFNLVLLANNCIVEQNQRNFTCFQSRVSLSRLFNDRAQDYNDRYKGTKTGVFMVVDC